MEGCTLLFFSQEQLLSCPFQTLTLLPTQKHILATLPRSFVLPTSFFTVAKDGETLESHGLSSEGKSKSTKKKIHPRKESEKNNEKTEQNRGSMLEDKVMIKVWQEYYPLVFSGPSSI